MRTKVSASTSMWSREMVSQKREQTFQVGEECTIVVETCSGDLELSGWDRHQVEVRSPDGEASVEQDGPKLRIRTAPANDLTLRVPHFSDVKARLVSGDARLADMSGTVDIETKSGDVAATNHRGDLLIHTVSGDVSLRSCAVTGLDLRTVSGGCLVESEIDQEGTYRVSSVSGDLRLLIPEDQQCTVRMHSLSGRLRCRLPHSTPRHRRRETEALINDGGVEFLVRTISGNVVVEAAKHLAQSGAGPAHATEGATVREREPETEPFGLDEGEAEETAPSSSTAAQRMEILRAIEEGEMSVDEGLDRLEQLD